jgi:hypothetical protein
MQELVLLGNIIMKFKTVNWITNKKSSSYKPQAPKASSSQAMTLEYKIIYTIDGDIPINPAWIRDQLQEKIDKLQKGFDKKKILAGRHKLRLQAPEGWALP